MRSTLGTLRSVVLLSLGCALPVIVQAQAGELPNHEHRGASDASWQFEQCMGGVTYGAPLKWALSYGMGMVRESSTHDLCVLGAAKIGFGGAGFATGLASSLGPFGSGVAVTGGVLRTFNDPMGALAKRTFVGGSVHIWPLLGLGGEIGMYRRMGSDAAGTAHGRGLLVWSVGFGF